VAYTTISNVVEALPHRTIDDTSVVNSLDVGNLIEMADKIVIGRFKVCGIAISEVIAAGYTDMLETIETLMTAGMVEQRLQAENGGEAGEVPNNNYYKEGKKLLEELLDNNEFDVISDTEDVIGALTGGEDELKAAFEKNKRQW